MSDIDCIGDYAIWSWIMHQLIHWWWTHNCYSALQASLALRFSTYTLASIITLFRLILRLFSVISSCFALRVFVHGECSGLNTFYDWCVHWQMLCQSVKAHPKCHWDLSHTVDNANASVPVYSKQVLWVPSMVGCSMNWMEIDSQLEYCMPWPFGYLHMWADRYLFSGRCNQANLQCIICFRVNCIFNFGFGHTPWGLHWRLDWLIKNILKGSPVQRAVGLKLLPHHSKGKQPPLCMLLPRLDMRR